MKNLLFLILVFCAVTLSKAQQQVNANLIGANIKYITAAANIQPGEYHIRSMLLDRPMDVMNGQNQNGVGLHLWDFHGGEAQKFYIERSNEAGYYYIKTFWGRVLDINGASTASGATLYTWDFHGGDNQKWKFIDVGNGYYNIQSKLGTYIDVAWGNSNSGAVIWMSEYSTWNNNAAQRWRLEATLNIKMYEPKPQVQILTQKIEATTGEFKVLIKDKSGNSVRNPKLYNIRFIMNGRYVDLEDRIYTKSGEIHYTNVPFGQYSLSCSIFIGSGSGNGAVDDFSGQTVDIGKEKVTVLAGQVPTVIFTLK